MSLSLVTDGRTVLLIVLCVVTVVTYLPVSLLGSTQVCAGGKEINEEFE